MKGTTPFKRWYGGASARNRAHDVPRDEEVESNRVTRRGYRIAAGFRPEPHLDLSISCPEAPPSAWAGAGYQCVRCGERRHLVVIGLCEPCMGRAPRPEPVHGQKHCGWCGEPGHYRTTCARRQARREP